MASVIVQRSPANRPGDDIIEPLLTDNIAKRERGRAEINREEDDRIIITGDGPKSIFLQPGLLAEVQIQGRNQRGSVTMFARTYTLEGATYQINSSVAIEVLSEAVRPEPV